MRTRIVVDFRTDSFGYKASGYPGTADQATMTYDGEGHRGQPHRQAGQPGRDDDELSLPGRRHRRGVGQRHDRPLDGEGPEVDHVDHTSAVAPDASRMNPLARLRRAFLALPGSAECTGPRESVST